MSLNFVEKQFTIGGDGNSESTFTFYKQGFHLGSGKIKPQYRDVVVSGTNSVILPNAKADGLNYVKVYGGTELVPEEYIDSVVLEGKCEQNNSPTPANPINIVCNNGIIKISPNIFNKNSTPLNAYCSNGSIVAHSTCKTFVVKVQPNTNYAFQFDNSNIDPNPRCTIYGFENEPQIGDTSGISYYYDSSSTKPKVHNVQFTTGNNINYLALWLLYNETQAPALDTVQLEKGLTQTTYMPYKAIYTDGTVETVTDNVNKTATAQMLLSCDTIKDTQEILSGNVTRNNGIIVLDGTESWSAASTTFAYFVNDILPNNANINIACICTHFEGIEGSINTGSMSVNGSTRCGQSSYLKRLFIRYNGFSDVTDLKDYLYTQFISGTPVIIVYALASQITETVTGQLLLKAPVTQTAGSIQNLGIVTTSTSHTVPSPNNPLQIRCNNGVLKVNQDSEIYADGTTETLTDSLGNTATAEQLLKTGSYKDVQEVLTGEVKRNVEIKILKGNEIWTEPGNTLSGYRIFRVSLFFPDIISTVEDWYCTHFKTDTANTYAKADQATRYYIASSGSSRQIMFCISESTLGITSDTTFADAAAAFNAWLNAQYNNGTPVIVVYPVATPAESTVTAQTLNTQKGTNTISISQASMSDLQLEVSYKAGVSVTITQIENANLDNQVTVTIGV